MRLRNRLNGLVLLAWMWALIPAGASARCGIVCASGHDIRCVEPGRYLCEVRSGQSWRLDNLKSFDEFLEKRFPESRRKTYYLMAIYEQLPRIPKPQLREVGWSKAPELAKIARREGQRFKSAIWLHKARSMHTEEFQNEVHRHLTGEETEPYEIIYFKLYKSQLPVIEQALETTALMLGWTNRVATAWR